MKEEGPAPAIFSCMRLVSLSRRKLSARPFRSYPVAILVDKKLPFSFSSSTSKLTKSCYAIWGHKVYQTHPFSKSVSKNQLQYLTKLYYLFFHSARPASIVTWVTLQHLKWQNPLCSSTNIQNLVNAPPYCNTNPTFLYLKNCMHVCKQLYNLWLKPQKGRKHLLGKETLL